jgi:hypothetical protein
MPKSERVRKFCVLARFVDVMGMYPRPAATW